MVPPAFYFITVGGFLLTTIVHREHGAWNVLHQHSSIGVPNEQVPVLAGMSIQAQEWHRVMRA